MAWHRPGDKTFSEPQMVRLPTHICVTRPQWVEDGVALCGTTLTMCQKVHELVHESTDITWNTAMLFSHRLVIFRNSFCFATTLHLIDSALPSHISIHIRLDLRINNHDKVHIGQACLLWNHYVCWGRGLLSWEKPNQLVWNDIILSVNFNP